MARERGFERAQYGGAIKAAAAEAAVQALVWVSAFPSRLASAAPLEAEPDAFPGAASLSLAAAFPADAPLSAEWQAALAVSRACESHSEAWLAGLAVLRSDESRWAAAGLAWFHWVEFRSDGFHSAWFRSDELRWGEFRSELRAGSAALPVYGFHLAE